MRSVALKEVMTSEAAFSGDREAGFDADEFHRPHSVGELLAGAVPLEDVETFAIDELTDEEAEAFLAALQT
jgi:hypothetical protein